MVIEALRVGHGERLLADPRVAEIVERALLHFDGQRYRLLAWCVMPTHVHLLAEQMQGHPLSSIVHSWKSFSANEANKTLRRSGPFWVSEYYDWFMRDEPHLEDTRVYIGSNPVVVGLCSSPQEWRFSSAWKSAGRVTRASSPPSIAEEIMRAGGPRYVGAQGLAEDVRYYWQWMRDEAEKRIGHLYPKAEITAEMARERSDLKPLIGQKLTVIAWLWARTVKSPNPAFASVDGPLASTFMLSTKPGKEAYVEPVIEGAPHGAPAHGAAASSRPADGTSAIPGYRFTVKVGKPKDAEAAKLGTIAGKRSAFRCLMSEAALTYDYIRAEGQSGRMGARLMAIVAEGSRGRIYLSPIPEQEAIARRAKPDWKPEMALPDNPRDFKTPNYGLTTFGDLFTDRQLVALTTFSDLVGEAREKVRHDALAAGLHDDGKPLRDGGLGATAYAEAIATFLAFGVDYAANYWSVIATPAEGFIRGTFARQALPMTWDYAEAPPFGDTSGNWMGGIEWIARACDLLPGAGFGVSCRLDAAVETLSSEKLISTDPPYYDNIGYADLSDLFYVWLRRSMRATFPGLFSTLAVPKAEELVATPYRHGGGRMPRDFS